ncbi:hypothetical protein GCM10010495_64200 [Kitasatospora herbaricolor]|nr:hypothetical protein GCM10010495_64200 [Kitasatospora herbaricolor]
MRGPVLLRPGPVSLPANVPRVISSRPFGTSVLRRVRRAGTGNGKGDVQGDTGPLPYIPSEWRTPALAPAMAGVGLAFTTNEFDVVRREFSDLEIRAHGTATG